MRAKNLEFFGKVYDMVLELNCDNPEESLCIAGSILAHYDWKRIKYAIENDWHLYDLDRWEMVARSFGRVPKYWQDILEQYDLPFTHSEYIEIMKDGGMFIESIVDPLYERDIEIVELVPVGDTKRTDLNCNCREALTE